MVAGTGDNTTVKHLLNTLMNSRTTHSALLRHITERDTCTLRNNLQNLTIQIVNLFHYFIKMIKIWCKDTVFFAHVQVFL